MTQVKALDPKFHGMELNGQLPLVVAGLLAQCLEQGTSFIAKRYLEKDLPLQVLRSGAGYYIGSLSEIGEPTSRDSEYYPTRTSAQTALDTHCWVQRVNP